MSRDVSGSPWKRQINGVGLNVHNDKCCCNAGNFPDPPSKPLVADILPYQLVEQNPTEKRWALIIGLQCRILIGNPQKMGAGGESVLALMGQELSTCALEDPVMQLGRGSFPAIPVPSPESVSAHRGAKIRASGSAPPLEKEREESQSWPLP